MRNYITIKCYDGLGKYNVMSLDSVLGDKEKFFKAVVDSTFCCELPEGYPVLMKYLTKCLKECGYTWEMVAIESAKLSYGYQYDRTGSKNPIAMLGDCFKEEMKYISLCLTLNMKQWEERERKLNARFRY